MLKRNEYKKLQREYKKYLDKAGIVITEEEEDKIEVADFGLADVYEEGLGLLVYLNTERVCVKDLMMLPRQTCPEHRHPVLYGEPEKEETFRCRWGQVYLYVSGVETNNSKCRAPEGKDKYYTVWHEIELNPGQQYTLEPNEVHWFQAGMEGAVISEYSNTAGDDFDMFTDPNVKRYTEVLED